MESTLNSLIQKTLEKVDKLLENNNFSEAMECAEIATELAKVLNVLSNL
ncbi:MAG TPA: hypothetical protein VN456_12370 [Desulfosporosinus sp.]|nr:hypothetical protein [Desulfosporosinus sp.]